MLCNGLYFFIVQLLVECFSAASTAAMKFDIEIKYKKGIENVAVDHLSRIKSDETSDDSEVDDNFPGETLMEITTIDTSWFADFANYLDQKLVPFLINVTTDPLVENHDENDVFANVRRHSEQPGSINDTYVLEKDDSNVIPDSSNICTNDNQVDQNATACVDERAALANLIANLTLDTEENKTILKQLKKANASLTQELKECKTNLDESSRALGEATSSRDSCLIALQTKQTELEKYTALNDLTSDYKILQTKLNETLGLLARKDIDIQEGLKTKTYEISVVNQKHDELAKKSLLTRSQFEGQLKEKTKVISDLKVKEGKDIDTMIEMDKQIKFLNEILYKRNQSIQTIHMLAPKCATYHGRSTFANPKYLKKAQSDKPRLYEIPYDTSDPANRFCPDGEDTVTLEKESRSKLDKDTVKPYNYTYQNSLYETFKPPSKAYLDQLERAKEVRKTMWRKTFVRTKPNIAKNVGFLPMSKSISKSRLLYNEMTNNFNHFRTICQQTWSNHTYSAFPNPTAKTMEVLIKTLLMPLSDKTILDSHCFVHELKKEMNDDLEYVNSLEKELDELESEKADFSNIYDLLLEECVSKDVTCSYLHSLSDLNANTELQCLYLHKVKECECLAQKLSKQTESVNKEIVQLILFIVDSGCTKHMTGNLKLLCNFVEKFLGYCSFWRKICLLQILGMKIDSRGMSTIKRVYYIEGLNHIFSWLVNSVMRIWRNNSSTPSLFLGKASPTQAWLWQSKGFSSENFVHHLISMKESLCDWLTKLIYVKDHFVHRLNEFNAKRCSFKTKQFLVPRKTKFVSLGHVWSMRVASINGIEVYLVIVMDIQDSLDLLFLLDSKDGNTRSSQRLSHDDSTQSSVKFYCSLRTEDGILEQDIHAYSKKKALNTQTSTPEHFLNSTGVVE
ncbi:hypothetical protein Tco_0009498 [Tanacetum coccineum]